MPETRITSRLWGYDSGGGTSLSKCPSVAVSSLKNFMASASIGGAWQTEWTDTISPGIYTIEIPDLPPVYYAVAYQPGEASLTFLEKDAKNELSEKAVDKFMDSFEALELAVQEETGVSEWWRWLVFTALGLLCLELYLGWRFSA